MMHTYQWYSVCNIISGFSAAGNIMSKNSYNEGSDDAHSPMVLCLYKKHQLCDDVNEPLFYNAYLTSEFLVSWLLAYGGTKSYGGLQKSGL